MGIWQKIWGRKNDITTSGTAFLVVGLGNPGKKYQGTRHNVGREALQSLVENKPTDFSPWQYNRRTNALMAEGQIGGAVINLILPETFMNLSGKSVRSYLSYSSPEPTLIVVHDDIDLPLGKIRLTKTRGAGGHNGVSSIIKEIGTNDFIRVRIGVGKEAGIMSDHVLQTFKPEEKPAIFSSLRLLPEIMMLIVAKGLPAAMSKYNK